MVVIGITGGSGSGKTYICTALKKLGYTIIDADVIAREVVMPGKPCLAEIVSAFGKEVLCGDGALNRKALANIVFSQADKLALLNKITHRYITERIQSLLSSDAGKYIIDAPLLYEAKLDLICDAVIGVTAKREIRLARIQARDDLTLEEASKRLDAQKNIENSLANADLCIETSSNAAAEQYAEEIDTFVKGVLHEKS